jgi:hypothetical protein
MPTQETQVKHSSRVLPLHALLLDESLGRQGAQGLAQVRRLESEVGLQFGDEGCSSDRTNRKILVCFAAMTASSSGLLTAGPLK